MRLIIAIFTLATAPLSFAADIGAIDTERLEQLTKTLEMQARAADASVDDTTQILDRTVTIDRRSAMTEREPASVE